MCYLNICYLDLRILLRSYLVMGVLRGLLLWLIHCLRPLTQNGCRNGCPPTTTARHFVCATQAVVGFELGPPYYVFND